MGGCIQLINHGFINAENTIILKILIKKVAWNWVLDYLMISEFITKIAVALEVMLNYCSV